MASVVKVQLLKIEGVIVGRLGNSYYLEGGKQEGVAYFPNISTALWKAVERLTVSENVNSLKSWAAAVEEKMLLAIRTCHEAAVKLDAAVRQAEQRKVDLAKVLAAPAEKPKAANAKRKK